MSFFQEFKQFAMRGNVVDMAVGIIIGGAFGKIVSSLVSDIIMPAVGILLGGVDFTKLGLTIRKAGVDAAGNPTDAVVLHYGNFIQNTVDFLIIAFSIFVVIRMINKLTPSKKEEEKATPPEPTKEEKLLMEIRDILKEDSNELKK
ncbi:MAG: large-conductance mechanosensitive channel protein MscL [Odoribacter sp.]|nr:large-conductance mechanosensitive channel protein MscL [Odoribacter sp.]